MAEELANRLRRERLARSWSLDELAQRSGVSRAMIHRVEAGGSSPTAVLLGKLSGALGLSMSELFADRSGPSRRLIRAEDRARWTDPESGYLREQIGPVADGADGSRGPQITRVTLPPAAQVDFPRSAFEFIDQTIWVQIGQLRFWEGGVATDLGPDDSLTLGEPQDCTFENATDEPCVYVVVVN